MNEPVAWMVAEMVFDTEEAAIGIGKTYDDAIIPLYTHPVKELTDEKIMQVYSESEIWVPDRDESDLIEFARAILRKAQGK